jgi:transcriptional regulator with XRE-family HTH domain
VAKSEQIGDRIRRERLRLEMTQRQLAAAVSVGVPHISKVEANRENPSDELLERLAKVFDIDAEELLISARKLPPDIVEDFASDPAKALAFLRTWKKQQHKPSR